jgi:hypothetical protein
MTNKKISMTEEEVKELLRPIIIKKLIQEGLITSDMLPGADGKLAEFAKKVDEFLEETAVKAFKLAEEGNKLRRTNFANSESVGERNRFLDTMTGKLMQIRNAIASTSLDIMQKLG